MDIEQLRVIATDPDVVERDYAPTIVAAADEIERLRAALKPFADSELLDKDEEGFDPAMRVLSWCSITIGDVLRARKIINDPTTGD